MQRLAEVHLTDPQQAGKQNLDTLPEGEPIAGDGHIPDPLCVERDVFRLVFAIDDVAAVEFHIFHKSLNYGLNYLIFSE